VSFAVKRSVLEKFVQIRLVKEPVAQPLQQECSHCCKRVAGTLGPRLISARPVQITYANLLWFVKRRASLISPVLTARDESPSKLGVSVNKQAVCVRHDFGRAVNGLGFSPLRFAVSWQQRLSRQPVKPIPFIQPISRRRHPSLPGRAWPG
jgi:hypothetical protein